MALSYYPRTGEILLCHFDPKAIGAEMIKSRPIVVIGPRLRNRGNLVTIVPLSTTAPDPVQDYHFEIELDQPLPPPFDSQRMWAKRDVICTVSILRLDRFKEPRNRHGGVRKWRTGKLDPAHTVAVQAGVRAALGLKTP